MSMQDKMMTVSHYLDTATSARNPPIASVPDMLSNPSI